MLLCPWGSAIKSASDLFILSSPAGGAHAGEGALYHILSRTLLVFYDLCVCVNWEGV